MATSKPLRPMTTAVRNTPTAPMASTPPMARLRLAPITSSSFSLASALASWISLRNSPEISETRPPKRSVIGLP